ncbi:23S rRNA (adenine(1618)-N(6))-methyltransferase RlmF [Sphingobacterium paludis]|jgi:23S rRNA (adenine1618-N6)-methyltransferase|uniref:Ribosomal RNA large subunit methyltransferase F n=1 Tax=Sphingobacterium paludis TaxID=1476465 RepID=A0A4R7D9V1_9SPHI|nr:23S rRNA (adenine(1618)-N(6))-methyltransferase RlmF [Sphingobacterium paludis]TDS17557.1 23S rRNA (adenine1618-N6)-methyltransferase [Sphingobacterium paludis]
MAGQTQQKSMHPRNLHAAGYDIKKLTAKNPALKAHVITTVAGKESINFSSPEAVFELNKSLLMKYYQIDQWSILRNSLCPPIPGRVDYVHYLADLLAQDHAGEIPKGAGVKILDIGTGSSCIYPILGQRAYQWSFVATDIEAGALNHAQATLKSNTGLKRDIVLRLQEDRAHIFDGIIEKNDRFDGVMCNPPFFKSREDNWQKSTKKFNNLHKDAEKLPVQNFGGHPNELWCEGGEKQFIRNMIYESMNYKDQLGWITTLVSDKDNVKPLIAILEYHKVPKLEIIPMAQGNKRIRILAWKWNA